MNMQEGGTLTDIDSWDCAWVWRKWTLSTRKNPALYF